MGMSMGVDMIVGMRVVMGSTGVGIARMGIQVSQGARRRSWPGRWEAVCSDSCS